MLFKRSFTWLFFTLLICAVVSSCQKDQGATVADQKRSAVVADSSLAIAPAGNFLAASGTLTIELQDSTYTFDAAKDSVAFVNLSSGDDHYFGITAINKAHTMSFAISSKGTAASDVKRGVEGSQLLLRPDALHIKQYTLTQYTDHGDAGVLTLERYRQDSVLAKGAFFTFMALDDKAASPFYRAEGTFTLKFKTQ